MSVEDLIQEYENELSDFERKFKDRIKYYIGEDVYNELKLVKSYPDVGVIWYSWDDKEFYIQIPALEGRKKDEYLIFGYLNIETLLYCPTIDWSKDKRNRKYINLKLGEFFSKLK